MSAPWVDSANDGETTVRCALTLARMHERYTWGEMLEAAAAHIVALDGQILADRAQFESQEDTAVVELLDAAAKALDLVVS
jgi:hypothetical protein